MTKTNGVAHQLNERNLSESKKTDSDLITKKENKMILKGSFFDKFRIEISGLPNWVFAIFLTFCITVVVTIWLLA